MRTTILLLAAALLSAVTTSAQVQPGQGQLQAGLSDVGTLVDGPQLRQEPATIEVPADHDTITEAIEAARNGDTILVHAGYYYEDVDFDGKEILLIAPQGPDLTAIIASGSSTAVTFQNGEGPSTILSGFQIVGGSSPTAGGNILCDNGSSPRITGCIIVAGSAPKGGGIACLNRSSPVIQDCIIVSNTGYQQGGGIHVEGSRPTIVANTIQQNSAPYGGGIHLGSSRATVAGNTFLENLSSLGGGGLHATGQAGPFLTDNTFTLNSGDVGGGAAVMTFEATIQDNVFDQNDAGLGGGLYLRYGPGEPVTGNDFSGNTSTYHGGGLYAEWGSVVLNDSSFLGNQAGDNGGGLYGYDVDLLVRDTVIRGNSADGGGGGLAGDDAFLRLEDSVVSFNVAGSDGGGLHLAGGSQDHVLVNGVIHDNQASGDGGGLYLDYADAWLTNVTITRNDATGYGGALAAMGGSWPRLTNTILWDDDAFADLEIHTDGSPVTAHRCDVEYGWPGDNMALPPLFADPAGGDFHLSGLSPCIDKGDNTAPELPAQDYEGDNRIINGDLVPGAVVDLGADEYKG